MSRSKKDILETESMLERLTHLLIQHHPDNVPMYARQDAEQLRRISMTLHRWHEGECNGDIQREEKWALERAAWPAADRVRWWDGAKWNTRGNRRTYDDYAKGEAAGLPLDIAWRETGEKPYWHSSQDNIQRFTIPDREAGAKKRLAKILKNYPGLTAYVQGDPRGCALYILRKDDIPKGATIDSCYSRGLAVYQ